MDVNEAKELQEQLQKRNQMLLETVFNEEINQEDMKQDSHNQNIKIVHLNSNLIELIIGSKKVRLATEDFVNFSDRKYNSLTEQSQKQNILMENRIRNLEKHIQSTSLILERFKDTIAPFKTQNKILEGKVNKSNREIQNLKKQIDKLKKENG